MAVDARDVRQVLEERAHERDVVHGVLARVPAAPARVPGEHALEAPAAAGIDDDEAGLVRLVAQPAEPGHRGRVRRAAVEGHHDRVLALAIEGGGKMDEVRPLRGADRDRSRGVRRAGRRHRESESRREEHHQGAFGVGVGDGEGRPGPPRPSSHIRVVVAK